LYLIPEMNDARAQVAKQTPVTLWMITACGIPHLE
jgi:hypothetical protein